jgi:hypothetical protein
MRKMTKTERAELDKCTALAKRIRTAERLVVPPAAIVNDASMLLTSERTMGDRRNQAQPSEVREVLELRLSSPAEYRARVERSRPAVERYGLTAVLPHPMSPHASAGDVPGTVRRQTRNPGLPAIAVTERLTRETTKAGRRL